MALNLTDFYNSPNHQIKFQSKSFLYSVPKQLYTCTHTYINKCQLSYFINLGWVSSRPQYCQLIRVVNKVKRSLWCQQQLVNCEDFSDAIWTDECSVMIERKRKSYRRAGYPARLKPKPKHPLKVHIWGAISMKGATKLVMFRENLNAVNFAQMLEKSLISFISSKIPDHHKFQQNNDPKHCSKYIKKFLDDHNIV